MTTGRINQVTIVCPSEGEAGQMSLSHALRRHAPSARKLRVDVYCWKPGNRPASHREAGCWTCYAVAVGCSTCVPERNRAALSEA